MWQFFGNLNYDYTAFKRRSGFRKSVRCAVETCLTDCRAVLAIASLSSPETQSLWTRLAICCSLSSLKHRAGLVSAGLMFQQTQLLFLSDLPKSQLCAVLCTAGSGAFLQTKLNYYTTRILQYYNRQSRPLTQKEERHHLLSQRDSSTTI